MARKSVKTVQVTKNPGQLSASGGELTNYLVRHSPFWGNPTSLSSEAWRAFVHRQPIASLCVDALVNHLISLDHSIIARDSTQSDELKDEIKHYTNLFERGNAYYSDVDLTNHIEWFIRDLFTLPFGTASEIGREYNSKDGRVVWIRPLDGGTLFPTLDNDYPVAQQYVGLHNAIFPREFISRVFLSPRTEIMREGWGMAPPEKIYLAMEMLTRGDSYYAQLLLNTPEAGILDLGDMEQGPATEWVKSMQDLFVGTNPWKVPVLYEHTTDVKWIPFGQLPNTIMYDKITDRYITIVTAGYGLSPSDIGFASSSNGGETLSGTIRAERRSNKSGKALAEKKWKTYADRILPDTLEWHWKNFDDEKNVALGRARMANGTAMQTFIAMQSVTPDEVRRQLIADGLFNIDMPETIDRKAIEWPTNAITYQGVKNSQKGSNEVGSNSVKPSSGGQGDVKPQQIISKHRAEIEVSTSKSIFKSNQILGALLNSVRAGNKNDFPSWEKSFEDAVVGKSQADLFTESVINDSYNSLLDSFDKEPWIDTVSQTMAGVISDQLTSRAKTQLQNTLLNRAEAEFVEEKRVDLSLTEDELLSIGAVKVEVDPTEVKKSLLESFIPMALLVSKSSIVDYKYDLDTTKINDNNNIKLAREVAGKLYNHLPEIIQGIVSNYKLGEN
jgi:hypothetical protein